MSPIAIANAAIRPIRWTQADHTVWCRPPMTSHIIANIPPYIFYSVAGRWGPLLGNFKAPGIFRSNAALRQRSAVHGANRDDACTKDWRALI